MFACLQNEPDFECVAFIHNTMFWVELNRRFYSEFFQKLYAKWFQRSLSSMSKKLKRIWINWNNCYLNDHKQREILIKILELNICKIIMKSLWNASLFHSGSTSLSLSFFVLLDDNNKWIGFVFVFFCMPESSDLLFHSIS